MANPLREQFGEVLFERIRADRYPSVTHMDMLESVAPPKVLVEYTLHLMDLIANEDHPSNAMIRRVRENVARWGP
jgi:hypothetical protein